MTTIVDLFGPRRPSLRHKLLCHYFTRPRAEHYLRELALLLQVDPANLSRELARLCREGIFRAQSKGRQKFFSLNPGYILHDELKTIVEKDLLAALARGGEAARQVYVIAGPNGSGKTTFAKRFLPETLGLKTFINADLIAAGISPLDAGGAAMRAGRLLLEEIGLAARKGIDFAFETTLSGRSFVHLFKELIGMGYAIHLFFLWIPNVDLSVKRVRERVRRGGHSIPEPDIRRRFRRGLTNLFTLYAPLVASWAIYDNSGDDPKLVASRAEDQESVVQKETYDVILRQVGTG